MKEAHYLNKEFCNVDLNNFLIFFLCTRSMSVLSQFVIKLAHFVIKNLTNFVINFCRIL